MTMRKKWKRAKANSKAQARGRSLHPVVQQLGGGFKKITYSKEFVRETKKKLSKCPNCGSKPVIMTMCGLHVWIKCPNNCRDGELFVGRGGWTLEEAVSNYEECVRKYIKPEPYDPMESLKKMANEKSTIGAIVRELLNNMLTVSGERQKGPPA